MRISNRQALAVIGHAGTVASISWQMAKTGGDVLWRVVNSDKWALALTGITFLLIVYRPLFWFSFTGPGKRESARVVG